MTSIKARTEPRPAGLRDEGEYVTQSEGNRHFFGHTKLFRIKSNSLADDFKAFSELYHENPVFLFYSGYILQVEPWALIKGYAENMDAFDRLGYQYMLKARHLAPNNLMYEWGLTEEHEKRNALAKRILEENRPFPLNDELVGQYFERILKAAPNLQ